jgi:hypothetical protein
MIVRVITCSRAALRIMTHKFLITLPPSAPVLTLERRVRMAEDAVDQGRADLAAARAREKPARQSHSPSSEEVSEFLARSAALTEHPDLPDLPGLPEGGGTRFSEEQIRTTAEYISRAGRRARGEEAIPVLPISARAIQQMPAPAALSPEQAAATSARILVAAAKRRGEIPLDEIPLSARVLDHRVDNPAETARAILAAAAKAKT